MSDAIWLTVFLAVGIERAIEAVMSLLDLALGVTDADEETKKRLGTFKKPLGVVLGLAIGFVIAYSLDLDLVTPMLTVAEFTPGFGESGANFLTGALIGGGAAPAHEVIKYIENKKKRAENQSDVAAEQAKAAANVASRAATGSIVGEMNFPQ